MRKTEADEWCEQREAMFDAYKRKEKMADLEKKIHDIYKQVESVAIELDDLSCGDNSCNFTRPSGMATNGGCRCLSRDLTAQEKRFAQRVHQMFFSRG